MSVNKKLAVFDLDGTLVDTGKTVSEVLNQIRCEIGKTALDTDHFTPWMSLGGEELIVNGLEVDSKKAITYLNEFRRLYSKIITPKELIYDGVIDLLEHLIDCGVNMCICTNKPRYLAEKVLADTKLEKYFTFMCAGGDLETKKPNPLNLDLCLKHFLQKSEDSIFIGDSSIDQSIANSLNVDFAFFTQGYNDGVNEELAYKTFKSHSELMYLFNLEMK